jgi:hypothetical protein
LALQLLAVKHRLYHFVDRFALTVRAENWRLDQLGLQLTRK